MSVLRIIARDLEGFKRELDSADAKRIKAAQTTARVEGYTLKRQMAAETKSGAPGGSSFAPLSKIAQRRSKRKPLAALAKAIRYWVQTKPFKVSVGFQDEPVRGSDGFTHRNSQLSRSWLYLARILQEGHTFGAGRYDKSATLQTASARTRILSAGFGLLRGKKSVSGLARFHLLRRRTRRLRIPPRPIVDPFWNAHRSEVGPRMMRNYERKLAGEKI
jgi:hypothetical protein